MNQTTLRRAGAVLGIIIGAIYLINPGAGLIELIPDVVPFVGSEELAKISGATLIEVGNDHRLADPEPLAAMLRACENV